MENQAVYRTKQISLEDPIDKIIALYVNDELSSITDATCQEASVILLRRLQWLGMQEFWTGGMQQEFIKLDCINEEIKGIISKNRLKRLDNDTK